MTTALTDRYVAATLHRVTGKHRREIDQDLRAAIAETTEAHIEHGQSRRESSCAWIASGAAGISTILVPHCCTPSHRKKVDVTHGPPCRSRQMRMLAAGQPTAASTALRPSLT